HSSGLKLVGSPCGSPGFATMAYEIAGLFWISSEDTRFMPRKRFGRNRKNRCRFCTPEGCPRPAYVDYKDVGLLKKLCTNQSKMFSRKRSGNCAAFQRASSDAVKRARFMALIPYVGE